MNTIDRTRREEIKKTLKCATFTIAAMLFVFVGLFALSGCQSYQPPGEELWRAL